MTRTVPCTGRPDRGRFREKLAFVKSSSRRLLLWFLPLLLGVIAAGVFAAGFAAALSGRLGTPIAEVPAAVPTATPATAPPGSVFRIVALGDSLTRGIGDGSGGGYPGRVAAAFRRAGRNVVVENLAVEGWETEEVLRRVRDQSTKATLAHADLILLSAGGNDLTHSLGRVVPFSDESSSSASAALEEARATASSNLKAILAAIRAGNPSAPIRLLGLYDPSGDAGTARRIERDGLLKWNVALEEASFSVPDCLVVPVADLFEGRPDRLAADRFHPGPSGYDEIAARVLSTLRVPAAAAGRQSAG